MEIKKFHEYSSTDIEAIQFFAENGFVVLKDVFKTSEVNSLHHFIEQLFRSALGDDISDFSDLLEKNYEGSQLLQWKRVATRLNHSLALQKLSLAEPLIAFLQANGLEEPCISTFPEVRVDMPSDAVYTQPWHQDWRYGQSSINSVTVWAPMSNLAFETGVPQFAAKTHQCGLWDYEIQKNPRRIVIKKEELEKLPPYAYSGNISVGSCIIFSQLTVHRSGVNVTNSARLSFQLRYADINCKDFAANGFAVPKDDALTWAELPF